ncbi:GNAT family N-acetyltransferase [Streptomyces sp. NPDC057699]|uniref:GNAT family N-acetyltransferase n=1 Tax=Streptomyces sp. NPDC057699 TaxID=3346220 RepID=UPI0036823524
MPFLVPPHIPPGRLSASPQPSLPVDGGLVLRPWRRTDAGAVLSAFSDPAIQHWHLRRADTEAEAVSWIEEWRSAWQAETNIHWAIVRPAGGGADEVLGRMALRDLIPAIGYAECAYWILPEARGSGLAPRAVDAVQRWAFDEETGFERLELVHSVRNEASCRVAAKCGFALEGIRRRGHLHSDGWHDMHVHARLRGEGQPGEAPSPSSSISASTRSATANAEFAAGTPQ